MTAVAASVGSDFQVATWRAIGVDIRLVVTDRASLPTAREIAEFDLAVLDLACSRFRPDSEIARIDDAAGRPVAISAVLAEAISVALDAAALTGGDLDPTLGQVIASLGYDRDFAAVPASSPSPAVVVRRRANWTSVDLDARGSFVRVPAGVQLDLGATAKAWAADRIAARVADAVDGPVLVGLGGDIAVAGSPLEGGWPIRVQDRPESDGTNDPAQTVALHEGGLATSSTTVRRWRRGGVDMHHLLDPWTNLPAVSPWRTVSVVAQSCLAANVASTTALIRGATGLEYLRDSRFPARLVAHDGLVTHLNGWPAP
jgi:thiamine biosynthesis lipoprotein